MDANEDATNLSVTPTNSFAFGYTQVEGSVNERVICIFIPWNTKDR